MNDPAELARCLQRGCPRVGSLAATGPHRLMSPPHRPIRHHESSAAANLHFVRLPEPRYNQRRRCMSAIAQFGSPPLSLATFPFRYGLLERTPMKMFLFTALFFSISSNGFSFQQEISFNLNDPIEPTTFSNMTLDSDGDMMFYRPLSIYGGEVTYEFVFDQPIVSATLWMNHTYNNPNAFPFSQLLLRMYDHKPNEHSSYASRNFESTNNPPNDPLVLSPVMAGSKDLYILATIGLYSNEFLRDYRLLVTDINSSEPAFKLIVEFGPEPQFAVMLLAILASPLWRIRGTRKSIGGQDSLIRCEY